MTRSWMNRVLVAALALAGTTAVQAQPTGARLTVIHGIPGLPAPVDVCVNGEEAFSFDFKDIEGPIPLPPGEYDFAVKLDGEVVLSADDVVLEAASSYTAIAHLTYSGAGEAPGIKLSLFENDIFFDQRPGLPRASIRHTADAPAVDAELFRRNKLQVMVMNLMNPTDGDPTNAGPVTLRPGSYSVDLFPAGSDEPVFEEDLGRLRPRRHYIVYAVGSIQDGTFCLLTQAAVTFPGAGPGDDDDDDGSDDEDDSGDDDGDDDD